MAKADRAMTEAMIDTGGGKCSDRERFSFDACHEVEWPLQARADLTHGGQVGQAGRHQDVRTGTFIGLQPADRIVEMGISTNKVLGARRHHELEWHATCNRDGGCDARRSEIDVVDRWAGLADGVLNRAPDKSYRARFSNGRRYIIRRIAKPFFQIGRHREIRGLNDQTCMRQRFRACHAAIAPSQDRGLCTARVRKRLKTKRGQHTCRTPVPGLGSTNAPGRVCKVTKAWAFLV
jgi:hypothetical protein